MATLARKPLPIDSQKSVIWAIESLISAGGGHKFVTAGVGLFDLVNRQTGRAHRLAFKFFGGSVGIPHIDPSGSFTPSGYTNFRTLKPVNFEDFDGMAMRVSEINLALYSWDELLLPSLGGLKIELASSGFSVPGISDVGGILEVLYGDGIPADSPDLEIQIETNDDPRKGVIRQVTQDGPLIYTVPKDVLFGFDKYLLKKSKHTESALEWIGNELRLRREPDIRFVIVGHTDNVGPADYNRKLSRRRAETVAKWLIGKGYLPAAEVKTDGKGASEPYQDNSTPEGRSYNRRVEGIALPTAMWNTRH